MANRARPVFQSPPEANYLSLEMALVTAVIAWTRQQAVRRPVDALQTIALTTEFVIACIAVGLLLSVYPVEIRQTLWRIGGEAGWNSNPRLRIYFFANYKEPPAIPLIWTQRLNETTLGISILSLAISLTRIFFAYFHITAGACNAFYDALLSMFWAYSVLIQASGDYSDPEHWSPRPWYLERGCGEISPSYLGICRLSRAAFGISVLLAVFHISRVIMSLLRVAYSCGKSKIFDGGAERAYRQFWYDENEGRSDVEKMSLVNARRGDIQ
ncbi:hypothetical protein F4808DRAFT_77167 [Astrocystis sublimbata]|nr:hypothetical protein F4808DRAFT_77167 [Astrocystis sublimbata]